MLGIPELDVASRRGPTIAEQKERITSFSLMAMLLLMQPRIWTNASRQKRQRAGEKHRIAAYGENIRKGRKNAHSVKNQALCFYKFNL